MSKYAPASASPDAPRASLRGAEAPSGRVARQPVRREIAILRGQGVPGRDGVRLDPGASQILNAYQRARRVDATAMAAVTDGLNRLFSNDVAPLRAVREAGLGLVNAIAPLRRLLATAAAGASLGAMPRLLKGEAL